MGSSLKRELAGIALLLFAVFLAAALGVLALAQLRFGVNVRENVGWVGWWLARPLVRFLGWPAAALVASQLAWLVGLIGLARLVQWRAGRRLVVQGG